MLSHHEIESLRRSHAMAPLAPSQVTELIEACATMSRERAEMETVLSELPASFSEVRAALNRLHKILR